MDMEKVKTVSISLSLDDITMMLEEVIAEDLYETVSAEIGYDVNVYDVLMHNPSTVFDENFHCIKWTATFHYTDNEIEEENCPEEPTKFEMQDRELVEQERKRKEYEKLKEKFEPNSLEF